MTIASESLRQDLIRRTQSYVNRAEQYRHMSTDDLNRRNEPDAWSVLECLEHLNRYGDFYIPALERSIRRSTASPREHFSSGLLGNYFAKSMLPREKLNKMKTFKDKNPLGSQLDKRTIERFLWQQQQLLDLLNKSRKVDLGKTKTAISISRWIKLKLGDTFRVVVYHNERHIVQADNVLSTKGIE